MKNLVKGLLCVGAAVAAGCVIAKRVQEIKELNKDIKETESQIEEENSEVIIDEEKKEAVKKAVMIAGGIFVVCMIKRMHHLQNEVTRLWDMMEVNKILWADRIYKDGAIDEATRTQWIMECVSHINDETLTQSFVEVK